jgi:predicted RecA/RadA family phage recombinase
MAREAELRQNIGEAVEWTWTNSTGTAVVAGEVLAVATISGKRKAVVALENIANGSSGQVMVKGRVNIKKQTSRAFTLGATVWWVAASNYADTAAYATLMTDFVAGQCSKAAAAADNNVEVDLNEGTQACSIGSSSSST